MTKPNTNRRQPRRPLTGNVRELIDGYIASDAVFREALTREAVHAILEGDSKTGEAILRDYV